jgi:hypothetical protein
MKFVIVLVWTVVPVSVIVVGVATGPVGAEVGVWYVLVHPPLQLVTVIVDVVRVVTYQVDEAEE